MSDDIIAGIDPVTRRCVSIGEFSQEYLCELWARGLILVPVSNETARSCYMEKQPDIFTLSRNDPNSPGAYKLPSAHEPTFQGRIEAACLALAYQGNIGLTTRMALMYPSTDIDAGSCAKYGAIVISRLLTAAAGALHQPQIDQISQELAEYLTSNYECS